MVSILDFSHCTSPPFDTLLGAMLCFRLEYRSSEIPFRFLTNIDWWHIRTIRLLELVGCRVNNLAVRQGQPEVFKTINLTHGQFSFVSVEWE